MEISNQQPCNGCAYASFITNGYFCNRGQMFVPFGYIGCKLTDDTREAIKEENQWLNTHTRT